MMRSKIIVLSIVIAGLPLAACRNEAGGDDESVSGTQTSAATPARPEDRFGKGFGEAYRADPNSEPAKVSETDVKPVSLTDEPLEVR